MELLLISAAAGTIAGIIDILPMLRMKLDRYAVSSAFLFYFLMPFVIFRINIQGLAWWLTGGLVTLFLALPILILTAKEDKKAIPPMVISALVLGTLIGMAGHFMIG